MMERGDISGPAAWLLQWATHAGSCRGGEVCTCGLTLARKEIVLALEKLERFDSKVVAWCEPDGDEWVVYDAESSVGQHIRDYQKASHGVSVFPIYGPKT